jgi:hypothetical protein
MSPPAPKTAEASEVTPHIEIRGANRFTGAAITELVRPRDRILGAPCRSPSSGLEDASHYGVTCLGFAFVLALQLASS